MNQQFDYTVVRSNRKTIAVQITPRGEILVRCPRRMRDDQIRAFVDSKTLWISLNLEKQEALPKLPVLTQPQLQDLLRQAREVLPARAAHFAPLIGVTFGKITVRAQHSRWGSCGANGNLNFNCLLMLTPPEIQDYVVVHELCHRKQMNHSRLFWEEVERILPDFRQRRQWLRENGSVLIARLGTQGGSV